MISTPPPDRLDKIIEKTKANPGCATLFALCCGMVFVWIAWAGAGAAFSKIFVGKSDLTNLGQWGDSFGGLNALFGAIGSALVASTLFLQYRSSEQQRKDNYHQRFESKFFELLRLMRELRSELYFNQSPSMKKLKSKVVVSKNGVYVFDAIKYAYFEVRHFVFEERKNNKSTCIKSIISDIYLDRIHRRFESRFAPYFRLIYTILYMICHDEELSTNQKNYFGNLLRSQLTTHEICLLAFNATADVSKDLAKYVVHFRLLKYVPKGRNKTILEAVYPPEAFSARD